MYKEPVYIDTINIYHHNYQIVPIAYIPLSVCLLLVIQPFQPSFLVGPLEDIQYPHRTDACKSLLIDQHSWVHV